MRLPILRRRLLLALGVPAIGCAGPSSTTTTTTTTGPEGDTISNVVTPPQPGEACVADQIEEMVCGATTPETCGPMGNSLTSYGQSTLYVTQASYGANDQAFADFWLDEDATRSYRAGLRQTNPGLPYESYCCYSHCTDLKVRSSAPDFTVPSGYYTQGWCLPSPPGGTGSPSQQDPACPGAIELNGMLMPYSSSSVGQCCYLYVLEEPRWEEEHHYRGRPARVDGAARYAEVRGGSAWTAELELSIAALPAETRARLAEAWTEVGRMEHASIAAFSNLALRLIAAGAPPELLAATHRAALDEIEHAKVAFALASAYASSPIAPGVFADAARMSSDGGLDALALETFVDGCIGETVAAAEAGLAASAAADPALAGALRTIAEDETRHAELAWQIVAWCVRAEPALGARLVDALARAQAAEPVGAAADGLREHGVLSARELARLRADVLDEVVAPCLAALVG